MGSIAHRLEREGRIEGLLAAAAIGSASNRVRIGPDPREVDVVIEALGTAGYDPPYDGQHVILYVDRRMILVAGGERAGKSYVSAEFMVTRVPYGRLFWIVADNYELARPEFNYAIDMLGSLGAIESNRDISTPKVGKATARLKTGQYIETKTADDVRKLAAVAPDGVIIAEAAQCPYEAFLRCVGRVAETRGWLLMSGTFEGSLSWYAEKYTEWRVPGNLEGGIAFSLPSWGNTYVYPGGRNDPEILRLEAIYSRVPGLFEERCGATPVPPVGLVFRTFRSSVHVRDDVGYDPKYPVYLTVDPSSGGNPYSVLAVQFHPRKYEEVHPDKIDDCHVVDEIYETGLIDEEMIALAEDRPWWKNVKGGTIDIEAPDSRKRWSSMGKISLQATKINQLEGIRRLKSFLHFKRDDLGLVTEEPHLHIAPHVRSLPYEFSRYKFKDPVSDEREYREKPPDDQPNHSIKALWYLLYTRYGPVKGARIPRVTKTWQKPLYRPRTSPLSLRQGSSVRMRDVPLLRE